MGVEPSPVQALLDQNRTISLDGDWKYELDPGNVGMRRNYFSADYDVSHWKTMPVPSQWYVQGVDYHGVVWFRREFEVPANFPG
jgi:beta-galactosidase